MAELKKGDVVQLKSSNTPKMNIESLGDFSPSGPSDGACCVCIDKNQKCSAVFDVACLVQIPASQKSALSSPPPLHPTPHSVCI